MPNFYNDDDDYDHDFFLGASLEIIFKIIIDGSDNDYLFNFIFNFEGEARPKDRIQGWLITRGESLSGRFA